MNPAGRILRGFSKFKGDENANIKKWIRSKVLINAVQIFKKKKLLTNLAHHFFTATSFNLITFVY